MATKVEYLWVDADGNVRGKTMVFPKEINDVNNLPEWNFDGSSTKQAVGYNSDVLMKPVAMFKDPFRGAHHKLVLCETFTRDGEVHPTNYRHKCLEVMEKAKDFVPQFGIEQEYTMMSRESEVKTTNTYDENNQLIESVRCIYQYPHKWLDHDKPGQGDQGPYYCGVGGGRAFGREIVEEHLDKCIEAGIKICGVNAEVMPSQWEFQIGICDGIEMGDHLCVARYILDRVSEKYDVDISLHPKPYPGDWNGTGGHTNFSTVQMRNGSNDKTGLEFIEEACVKLCKQDRHDAHMAVYGENNELRMTGKHETASFDKCTWGLSDRGKSIRVPLMVKKNQRGYLEDRRPSSHLDPYRVTTIIVETTCLMD